MKIRNGMSDFQRRATAVPAPAAVMGDYRVFRDGWVAGQFRPAGTILRLSEAEAKYELNLTPVTAPAPRRRRPAAVDGGGE